MQTAEPLSIYTYLELTHVIQQTHTSFVVYVSKRAGPHAFSSLRSLDFLTKLDSMLIRADYI
jgi:hypothetical protein